MTRQEPEPAGVLDEIPARWHRGVGLWDHPRDAVQTPRASTRCFHAPRPGAEAQTAPGEPHRVHRPRRASCGCAAGHPASRLIARTQPSRARRCAAHTRRCTTSPLRTATS